MRLVTHNMLRSNVKGAVKGYPLGLEATEVVTEESDYDAEMIERLLARLDYNVLCGAAAALSKDLPKSIPDGERDDDFLRTVHHALLEVHVVEGALICPDTGRRFPIQNGIPNMLLNEDEIAD